MYKLSLRSIERLNGVHPDLVLLVHEAIKITEVDFGVTCGLRTAEEQAKLLAEGKSKTMKSRHLTGHAVDLVAYVDGKVTWEWEAYEKIAKAMKSAADTAGVPIEWGGDWMTFKDGPHFQLPWAFYGVEKAA
jgi:peptidoglycan L-alanyl-D-glutamate endopeptidase CwlK